MNLSGILVAVALVALGVGPVWESFTAAAPVNQSYDILATFFRLSLNLSFCLFFFQFKFEYKFQSRCFDSGSYVSFTAAAFSQPKQ